MTHIRRYETTGRPVFITAVLNRRVPYLKNLVGQVAPQALPDAFETKWSFFSDQTGRFLASGDACVLEKGQLEYSVRSIKNDILRKKKPCL